MSARSARLSSRPISTPNMRRSRWQCRRLPDRGAGRAIVRGGRGQPFRHPRPAAAAVARLSARARAAARADGRALCRGDRRSDRPFQIAADPQILAGEARASRAIIAPMRVHAEELARLSRQRAAPIPTGAAATSPCRTSRRSSLCWTSSTASARRIGGGQLRRTHGARAAGRHQYRRRRASSSHCRLADARAEAARLRHRRRRRRAALRSRARLTRLDDRRADRPRSRQALRKATGLFATPGRRRSSFERRRGRLGAIAPRLARSTPARSAWRASRRMPRSISAA